MITNLVKHAAGWGVVIDPSLLDRLQIRPGDPVEISSDGKTITIAPGERSVGKDEVRAARKKVNARFRKAFQKLAE